MDEHPVLDGFAHQGLPVPAAAGDVLLFDALTFHTPGANHSHADRPSLTLGYRAVDELDRRAAPPDQVLVAGSNLYRGNSCWRR
ncbi:hypothetical protein GCM10010191_09180 [Actinomadura vinacea]|uniref:Phytanoyl-CoA dioxygenase n=2 Tax=Actinomadura vinacea TaxID=115336 RepID=A0ABN3IFV2_9ACTN